LQDEAVRASEVLSVAWLEASSVSRPELHLEGNDTLYGGVDSAFDRALALVGFDSLCDLSENPVHSSAESMSLLAP